MKIALIAPIEESVPPIKYGGTEWIVYHLAHELGKRHHVVHLYASGDSPIEQYYQLVPSVEKSIRSAPLFDNDMKARESAKWLALSKTIELLNKENYDLIHNHASWRFLTYANLLNNQKILTTHHGPLNLRYQNIVFNNWRSLPFVSISDNQRRDLPNLNFVKTIYNGTDVNRYPYYESEKLNFEYMLFLARMSPEKGAIEAAKAAITAKKKLLVCVKIDKNDRSYFSKFEPLIDKKYVSFTGEVGGDTKISFLQMARCLMAPIQWEEPFGLMFTEAMSCGTPVVAYARGSVPEVVKDGETGFIVNSSDTDIRGNWIVKKTGIEGLCEAVERIYSMPEEKYRQMRRNCRAHVEKNFTVERMVNQYEEVYQKILENK